MKFTGQYNHNWRSLAMLVVLAGAAMAQTTPPPTPPATAPAAPAAPAVAGAQDRDEDAAREAARAKREADRAMREQERATARAKLAEDRARRASTARVYMFGEGSYLGVDIQDVTKDRLPALKLKEERGAEVTMVDQDGPAGKAGLKEGDVILSFNGDKVESAEQLKRMIHEIPPGRSVALGVSRNGQAMSLNAKLADRRELGSYAGFNAPHVVIPPMPPIRIPSVEVNFPEVRLYSTALPGLSLEALTPQLGDFFGAPEGHGMLVRSVEKGSAADQAGLKAGDVIIKVGAERIADSGDWRMAVRGKSGPVPVTIVRDKREQTVTVKIPERRGANRDMMVFDSDAREFAFDSKEFEKQMKDMQQQWEKAGKDWEKAGKEFEKTFKFDFRYDDDDAPAVAPKKKIENQQMKKPATTIILKDKTAA